MTVTYWEVGRRIVQAEQKGEAKAEYGAAVIEQLAGDLTAKLGRGFRRTNLFQMRAFYLAYGDIAIPESVNGIAAKIQTLSEQFPLPWSHYVKLISIKDLQARAFYETEALKHGWSVRQMARQISIQLYERIEHFLLELGGGFAFMGHQRRLRNSPRFGSSPPI